MTSNGGKTAAALAAMLLEYEMVVYLLERGADHLIENIAGASLAYWVDNYQASVEEEIWRKKANKYLNKANELSPQADTYSYLTPGLLFS